MNIGVPEILLCVIVVELGALVWKAWDPREMKTCYYCKKLFPVRSMKTIGSYLYCKEHARRTR